MSEIPAENVMLHDLLNHVQKACSTFDWRPTVTAIEYPPEGMQNVAHFSGTAARIVSVLNSAILKLSPSKQSADTFPLAIACALVMSYRPDNEGVTAAMETIFSPSVMKITKAIHTAFVLPHQKPQDREAAAAQLMETMKELGYLDEKGGKDV